MLLAPLSHWFMRHPVLALLMASLLLYTFAGALERFLRMRATLSVPALRADVSDSVHEA